MVRNSARRSGSLVGGAGAALRRYYEGMVLLTQRRVTGGTFAYIATKRCRIVPPAVTVGLHSRVEKLLGGGGKKPEPRY